MIVKDECVKIGYISKTHGVKGEVSFTLHEGFFADNVEAEFLLLDIDNGLVPFVIESMREKGNKTLLVKLGDIETEVKARDLVGTEVYLESTDIQEDESVLVGAFVGFKVHDKGKGDIGTIVAVNEISNNPLFVLDFEGNEILFPINPDFIINVDEEKRLMDVDLPEGLIDLYLSEDEEDDF